MFSLSLLLLLAFVSADCSVSTDLLILSSVEKRSATAVTCPASITSCVITPPLPPGLNISPICVISGKAESIVFKKQYKIDYVTEENHFTGNVNLVVTGTLTKCDYGVTEEGISISSSQAFTIQPPRCDAPITLCTSENMLNGVTLDSDGKIYTTGPTDTVEQTDVLISCTDGISTVDIPIKLSVGSNVGSSPIQYFQYPSKTYYLPKGIPVSFKPTNYIGTITGCEASTPFQTGLTLDPNTCTLSGSFTAMPSTTEFDITISASNLFSKSKTTVKFSYVENQHGNFQGGFLLYIYKFENAKCDVNFRSQDLSSAVLKYIASRDYINYTQGSLLWPEYGWNLEQKVAFKSINYHGATNTRIVMLRTGAAHAHIYGIDKKEYHWDYNSDAACTLGNPNLVGNIGFNVFEYSMARGSGPNNKLRYEIHVAVGTTSNPGGFMGPNLVHHYYYGHLEYSLMYAIYPYMTPIPANVPRNMYSEKEFTYSIYPDLPSGLRFDPTTGIITGYAEELTSVKKYVVTAKSVDGSAPDLSCQLDIGIEEYNAKSAQFSCSTNTVNGFVDIEMNSVTCSPSTANEEIKYHTVDLPAGITLSEDGVISGIATEVNMKHISIIYGYTINGVSKFEIEFNFKYECLYSLIVIRYRMESEGTKLTLKQGEEEYFVSENIIGNDLIGKACIKDNTTAMTLSINSNANSGGKIEIYMGYDMILFSDKVKDFNDVRDITIDFPGKEKPEIIYPEIDSLIYGFYYYIAPISIKNGVKTFTGGYDLIGLKFDTKTGALYGRISSTIMNFKFDIQGSNDYGISNVTQLKLNSKFCKDSGDNKQLFKLVANINENDRNTSSIDISKSDGSSIFSISKIHTSPYEYPFCDTIGNYKATYTLGSSADVKITSDGTSTITKLIPGKNAVTDFFINYKAFDVTMYYYTFEYKDDWKTSTNTDGVPVAATTTLGEYKEITKYYKAFFKTSTYDLSDGMILKLTYAGGIVVHINNNLVYINNLPDEYTSETESIGKSDVQTVEVAFLHSILKTDDTNNIITFEIHIQESMKGSSDKTIIDMYHLGVNSCSKVLSVNDVKITAFASTGDAVSDSKIGEFELTGGFAGTLYDSSNKFFYDFSSYNAYGNTWFKYHYHMPTLVNYYSMKGIDANWNRYAVDWDVLGSNDDNNWEVLQSIRRHAETRANEDINYYMSNMKGYSYYLFNITSRGLDDDGLATVLRVGGIRPYFCNYPKTCEGDIPMGTSRYLTCPEGQQSPERTKISEPVRIVRECRNVNGVATLQADVGNTCKKERFWFDLSEDKVIGFVGKEVPTYRAFLSVDRETTTTITSDPQLPSGIKIDQLSGRIYGKTNEVSESKTYTITATNEAYPSAKTVSRPITLEIQMAKCGASEDGIWPETEINKVLNISCGEEFFGEMTRECKLDENGDPQWSEIDKSQCHSKVQTNCRYKEDEYFFDLFDEVDIQCSCDSNPKEIRFEPSLPSGWKYYTTGAITGRVESEFDVEYTITFVSADGYEQIVKLRITSLPELESCSYGFDNNELKLYKMYVDIAGPKCIGYYTSMCSSPSNPLPDGLVLDENTGAISGFITNEIATEGIDSIIMVKGSKNNIEVHLKFKRNNENNLLQGFRALATTPYDYQKFSSDQWNDVLTGKKSIEGSATVMTRSIYPEKCPPDFVICQNTLIRAEGYLKINEAGNYVLWYKIDDNGNVILPGFDDFKTPTANWNDAKTATVNLKPGYVYTGLILGLGAGANTVEMKIKKEGEDDTSYKDMSEMMYRGGFLIQHLTYSSDSFIIKSGQQLKLVPSYHGVPSKWRITPSLSELSFNEYTGIIEGSISSCNAVSKDKYTITAYTDDGLSSSTTILRLLCIDDSNGLLSGLDLTVYSVDNPNVDSFTDPTTAAGVYKTMETIAYPNHERSDEIWNGFSVLTIYSFIADYNGFIKVEQAGDYVITMKCYDYCRLYLPDQWRSLEKYGKGYGIRTLSVKFEESRYYPIRITYTKGSDDITKQLEFNIVSTALDISSQAIDKFLYHTPKTTIQYETSFLSMYELTAIKENILVPFQTNITSDCTFKVNPPLPTGLSLKSEGIISGTPSISVKRTTYTISVTLPDKVVERVSFVLEVLSNEKSEIVYPQIISASNGENINVNPTNITNCVGFRVDDLPFGVTMNSRTGIISGVAMATYEKDITITCLSPNPDPVNTLVRISISGCPSSKSYFTFGYYIYHSPKDVSFEITYGNGIKVFPPEGYDVTPELNTYYSYGSCITTQQTYTLNIKCNSIGGYIKLYYGPLLFKYFEFNEDTSFKFQLTDHANEKPRLNYPNDNHLEYVINKRMTFSPVLVYNGANVYSYIGSIPDGIEFDPETGSFVGTISTGDSSSTSLKVIATNEIGDSEEVELELTTIQCPYEEFKVSFFIYPENFKGYAKDEMPYKLYYTLSNYDRVVADEVAIDRTQSNYYCLNSGAYILKFGNKVNTNKWEYAEIYVKMIDEEGNEETIVRDYYHGGNEEGNSVSVNIRTYLNPSTKWSYSDGIQTSDLWKESGKLEGEVLEGPVFKDLVGVTRYYVAEFDFGEMDTIANIASFVVNCKFEGGMILYVNGYEYYRYNLPSGEITSETLPIENNDLKNRRVKGPISLFNIGRNIIAIEIHRKVSNEVKPDSFVMNYLYISAGQNNCINDAYEVTEITGNYRDKEAIPYYNQGANRTIDGDLGTKMYIEGAHNDAYLQFDFSEDYYQYYNSYMYRSYDFKNGSPTREIYKFSIYAVNGEGNDHKYLLGSNSKSYDERLGRITPSTVSKDVSLKPMKSMRIEFETESNGGEITDLLPAVCHNMCLKEGKWSPAYIGTKSKINCGFNTEAGDERECLDMNGSPMWGDEIEICSKRCNDNDEYGIGVPGGESKQYNCGNGYNGYTYKYCSMVEPVKYSEVKRDKCIGWYPSSVTYSSVEGYVGKTSIKAEPNFVKDSELSLSFRRKDGSEELPNGLSIDNESGIISGIIAEDASVKTYHMTIEIVGTRTIESEFDIVVKDVTCPIDSGFPATKIGEKAVIPCVIGEENDKNKTRDCTFDEAIKAPKWGIIDASACGSTAIPVVKYSNEGKMIFTIDVESSSEIPEKTDVTKLELNDLDGLKTNYGLIFDIATGEVFGKCKKEDRDVEYIVTPYNGETKGDDVTIKIRCEYGKPESILYNKSNVIAYIGGEEITLTPSVVGHASSYKINPNNELDKGIVFDTTTGIIVINAKSDLEMLDYTIQACNGENCASTKVSIDLRYKRPESISYLQNKYIYTIGDSVELIPVEEKQEGVKYEIIPLSILTNIGLSFDDKTGKLSGRVNKALSKSDFTLKAYNRDGEAKFLFSFAVSYGEPPEIEYVENNIVVYVGVYVSIAGPVINSDDSSLRFTIDPALPNYLNIDSLSGSIEGELKDLLESTTYTVTVSNDLGKKTTSITLKGMYPAPSLLEYKEPDISINIGKTYESEIPRKSDHITSIVSEPSLPFPFVVDRESGKISTSEAANKVIKRSSYVIIASNEAGSYNTTITIAVTNPPPVINNYEVDSVKFVIGVEKRVEGPRKAEGSVIDKFSMNPDTLLKISSCGLTFSEIDGSISGTATSALESTTAVVYAINDGGDSNSVKIIIRIANAPPSKLIYGDNNKLKLYVDINNNVGPSDYDSSIIKYTYKDESGCLSSNNLVLIEDSGSFLGSPAKLFTCDVKISGCNSENECLEVDVNIECVYPKPGTLGYASQTMKAIIGETFSSGIPTKSGQINEIKEGENFPSEFKLDHNTGEITGEGYTTRIYPAVKFTVITSNAEGDTPTDLSLEVIYPKPTKVEYTSNNFTFTQTEYSETSEATTDAEYIIEYSYSPVTLAQYGLEFDKSTGKIFGSATKYSSTPLTYTITARNANGSAKTQIKIYMVYPAPKSVKYKNENMVFTMGKTTMSEKPVVEGTATSFTIEPEVSLYGLKFDIRTGQVSGNSEIELKKTEFTVTAINEKGSVDTKITITINYPKPNKIAYGTESMKFKLNEETTYIATITAGKYTTGFIVRIEPKLPSGLEIDEKTGKISGAATTLDEEGKVYRITATNSGGSTSIEITISVLKPLVTDWRYNVPTKPNSPFTLLVNFGEEFDSGIPTYKGEYDSLEITNIATLEMEGFTVDESNGRITGKAKNNNRLITFTINAINSGGKQPFTITLNVNYALPKSLSYTNPLVAIVNEPIEPANPKLDGEMQNIYSFNYYLFNFPGLSMSQTGVITGTTRIEDKRTFEITYGNYERGFLKFNLTVISTKPSCLPDEEWPVTNYGSIAAIMCEDPEIGFRTRYCHKNNITGEGEWGSIVDGCVEATPIPQVSVGKVVFNVTLQGEIQFSEFGEEEIVAIAQIMVKLIDKPEVNITDIAIVLYDETNIKQSYYERLLDTRIVRAEVRVTVPLGIAKDVQNAVVSISEMEKNKVLNEFTNSPNKKLNNVEFAEVSRGVLIVKENNDDDSNNSSNTLYIIIGAVGGVIIVIALVVCMLCYCRSRKNNDRPPQGMKAAKSNIKV